MEIPVYMFTGFLESGKTKFINESLADRRFNAGESTLLLLCEEGIEEYDDKILGNNIHVVTVEDKSELSPSYLSLLEKQYKAERVIVEYNGMWLNSDFYGNMPENWTVYQEVFFADAGNILNYNNNMRSLVVDKLTNCEMAAFNRFPKGDDVMPYHKLVRAVNTRSDIMYEHPDGTVDYDDIEDPPPYNKEADEVVIEDKDYAVFYRDVMENTPSWDGKTVSFKGVVCREAKFPDKTVIIGRHVMTCCVEDIKYMGLVFITDCASRLNNYDWLTVKAKIEVKFNKLYRGKGPVLFSISETPTKAPEQPVATFY